MTLKRAQTLRIAFLLTLAVSIHLEREAKINRTHTEIKGSYPALEQDELEDLKKQRFARPTEIQAREEDAHLEKDPEDSLEDL